MAAIMMKSAILALGLTLAGTASATPVAVCQMKLLRVASEWMEHAPADKYANMGLIREIYANMYNRRHKVVLFGEGTGEKPQCLIQVIMEEAKADGTGCIDYKVEEIDITCP